MAVKLIALVHLPAGLEFHWSKKAVLLTSCEEDVLMLLEGLPGIHSASPTHPCSPGSASPFLSGLNVNTLVAQRDEVQR